MKKIKSTSPRVSVVIPNFNNSMFILDSIQSVINQSFQDFEILVVDDGSTDDSLRILRNIDFPLKIIETSNQGVSSARNRGMLEARGELIALLDSDDLWSKNKLESQINKMDESKCDLVYCHGSEFNDWSDHRFVHTAEFRGNCYDLYKKFPTKSVIVLPSSSTLFKRDILAKSGLFDPAVPQPAEDWDFFQRISKYASIDYCDEVLVYYRRHSGNASNLLHQYLKGNKVAVKKLISNDANLSFLERRKIWMRFQLVSAKVLFGHGNYTGAVASLVQILLPILI